MIDRHVRIVGEQQLREALALDTAVIDTIEQAFVALSAGRAVMPPVLSMDLPAVDGEVDIKTAWIEGFEGFAVKVSPGFFNNPKQGLPSLNGLMLLLDSGTGLARNVFLDNGYLTALRTAAAGAVAARHLAPSLVTTAGLIGAGEQARLQLLAAHQVRPFSRLLIYARRREAAAQCGIELAAQLNIDAEVVDCAEDAVSGSQLLITTTPASTPLFDPQALHAGLHITAMGSDQAGKNELHPEVLNRADAYVCDSVEQCRVLGEWRSALESGNGSGLEPAELGSVISGEASGRRSDADLTVCDLTGTGVQDTAIATLASLRCAQLGVLFENME